MSEGFIQIRRGLQDHLVSGALGAFDLGVYLILHLQADFRSGIWIGSAPRLMATAPRGTSLRDMQRALARLAEIGFVKTFQKRGARGNYRVLLNKYEPRSGALRGMRLNAEKTLDWRQPVFEPCAEPVTESDVEDDAETGTEAAPYLEVEVQVEQQLGKPRAAKPPAPSDHRFRSFIDFAYHSFESKHSQKPTWNGKDFKNLTALLRKNPTLAASELERRWNHYSASTESFTAKQGDSLAYFCAKFDSFIDGPILGSTGGKTDGKVSGHQERQKRTLEARERALSSGSRWDDKDRPLITAGG